MTIDYETDSIHQAPVVQRVYNTYPLDSDLSGG